MSLGEALTFFFLENPQGKHKITTVIGQLIRLIIRAMPTTGRRKNVKSIKTHFYWAQLEFNNPQR